MKNYKYGFITLLASWPPSTNLSNNNFKKNISIIIGSKKAAVLCLHDT